MPAAAQASAGVRPRVGFLGPEGTVSHAALVAAAPGADGIPLPTLREVVLAVQDGRLPLALVPIENAFEGPVNPVWDALALEAPDVVMRGEHLQPVTYCLAAGGSASSLDEIVLVHSHPQATAQCTRWLAANLPDAGIVAAASTADAVRAVAGAPDGGSAAIGLRFAAERYGARILAEGLEDDPGNATRFALLAHADRDVGGAGTDAGDAGPDAGDAGPDAGDVDDVDDAGANAGERGAPGGEADAPHRTALVFWGDGDDAAGWLVACLSEFASRELNLTRIVSRPLRRRMGHYMFFLELDGAERSGPVSDAIAALRARAETVRVLGSYPLVEGALLGI